MTLVIMAAGLGSRFGGTKQLETVDSFGHTLIDYSVFDAVRAGFRRVVFVIKRSIERDFKTIVLSKIEKYEIDVSYVFQEVDDLPRGFVAPKERVKPWGTAHAVCRLKGKIDSPFALINADDYYGPTAFLKMRRFFSEGQGNAAMIGYRLKNTLSINGSVSRGVCKVESGYLSEITEITDIKEQGDEIRSGKSIILDPYTTVSMNFWGFTPDIIDECEIGFVDFLKKENNLTSITKECYLTDILSNLIKAKKVKIRVIENGGNWCGMTYREDKEDIVAFLDALTKGGMYPENF